MSKKGLWMVYDSEENLVCIADYDTALKEYEKCKQEQENWVLENNEFTCEERVILAKVEKDFYPTCIGNDEESNQEIWDFVEDVQEDE